MLFRGLFVLHLPFLPLKETVAVRLKRAILLLNLELKIPGGAAHGLCSPQVGGSLMRLTGLARGRFETVSDLLRPRLPYRAHLGTPGHGSGVYTVMKYSWLGVPAATRGGRRVASRKPWPGRTCRPRRSRWRGLCLGRAGPGAERSGSRSAPGQAGPRQRFLAFQRVGVLSNLGHGILPHFKPVIDRRRCTRGTVTTTELNCAPCSDLRGRGRRAPACHLASPGGRPAPPGSLTLHLNKFERSVKWLGWGAGGAGAGVWVWFFFFWKRFRGDLIKTGGGAGGAQDAAAQVPGAPGR